MLPSERLFLITVVVLWRFGRSGFGVAVIEHFLFGQQYPFLHLPPPPPLTSSFPPSLPFCFVHQRKMKGITILQRTLHTYTTNTF